MNRTSELPELTHHLGWLWRLVDQALALVDAGARTDLAERCTGELRRQPRAALLALADEELSQADVTHALIRTGLTAEPPDTEQWEPDELRTLQRLSLSTSYWIGGRRPSARRQMKRPSRSRSRTR